MTNRGLAARWPTGLALVTVAAALALIVALDREAEFFGPAVATMAGIYVMAYAIGRPWTAWVAFAVLSAVASAFHGLDAAGVWSVEPGVGMVAVLVVLWVWAVVRRRYAEPAFTLETAGTVFFGALTIVVVATESGTAIAVAGLGWLLHGAWDSYHFRANTVVARSWAEYCGVIDLAVGTALLVTAVTR
ncbi:hypothetical protein E1218_14315 [Kribbella turkmenica]|uniref:Uncharacterized protein n=1 Tax=Kribbella turkmenica TaxID=2530375 RepID=A0A4R4X628_9ACTN|nr:hypothetical protein [Kribbella turkmenica]TDD25838.1 hypothetical protein E1218_14315 [Kribbella turkmenica]